MVFNNGLSIIMVILMVSNKDKPWLIRSVNVAMADG